MKEKEMIDAFVQSELSAIESGQGDSNWFCMYGHRLKKDVVAAAPACLAKEPLIQFYSLLLRRGLFFEEPIKNHYPEWEAAYRAHTPWMVKRPFGWSSSIDRLIGLCIFGFDQKVEVGKNDGYQDYCLYLQAMKIHGSNMPDIVKKSDRLLSFAGEEKVINRFSVALTGLDFIYDDWYGVTNTENSYAYANLALFNVLLILHLSKIPQAKDVINEYKKKLPFLPMAEEQNALIARCAVASNRFA